MTFKAYFRNRYQKSSPCESIKKWSTAVKYAMQTTNDTSTYTIVMPIALPP